MFVLSKRIFWVIAISLAYFSFAQSELVEIEVVAKVEQRPAINPIGAVYGAKSCGK